MDIPLRCPRPAVNLFRKSEGLRFQRSWRRLDRRISPSWELVIAVIAVIAVIIVIAKLMIPSKLLREFLVS